jgi:Holliday junction DNA helicase RuvA
MYEAINGKFLEITPTYIVIENNGIAFLIHISLNTFSNLNNKETGTLFVHQIIREDAHLLFGFASKTEREYFRMLISVSGIGANTARLILSSLKPSDIKDAIQGNNVALIKNVKGIGEKTAQRLIIELRDKIEKADADFSAEQTTSSGVLNEAISALLMLGFPKAKVEKIVQEIYQKNRDIKVEELVKYALKSL